MLIEKMIKPAESVEVKGAVDYWDSDLLLPMRSSQVLNGEVFPPSPPTSISPQITLSPKGSSKTEDVDTFLQCSKEESNYSPDDMIQCSVESVKSASLNVSMGVAHKNVMPASHWMALGKTPWLGGNYDVSEITKEDDDVEFPRMFSAGSVCSSDFDDASSSSPRGVEDSDDGDETPMMITNNDVMLLSTAAPFSNNDPMDKLTPTKLEVFKFPQPSFTPKTTFASSDILNPAKDDVDDDIRTTNQNNEYSQGNIENGTNCQLEESLNQFGLCGTPPNPKVVPINSAPLNEGTDYSTKHSTFTKDSNVSNRFVGLAELAHVSASELRALTHKRKSLSPIGTTIPGDTDNNRKTSLKNVVICVGNDYDSIVRGSELIPSLSNKSCIVSSINPNKKRSIANTSSNFLASQNIVLSSHIKNSNHPDIKIHNSTPSLIPTIALINSPNSKVSSSPLIEKSSTSSFDSKEEKVESEISSNSIISCKFIDGIRTSSTHAGSPHKSSLSDPTTEDKSSRNSNVQILCKSLIPSQQINPKTHSIQVLTSTPLRSVPVSFPVIQQKSLFNSTPKTTSQSFRSSSSSSVMSYNGHFVERFRNVVGSTNTNQNTHLLVNNLAGMSCHVCTICNKKFKDRYSVNVHVRTHTGEKPFACVHCSKRFRQKAHLAKHMHTHSGSAMMTQSGSSGSALSPSASNHLISTSPNKSKSAVVNRSFSSYGQNGNNGNGKTSSSGSSSIIGPLKSSQITCSAFNNMSGGGGVNRPALIAATTTTCFNGLGTSLSVNANRSLIAIKSSSGRGRSIQQTGLARCLDKVQDSMMEVIKKPNSAYEVKKFHKGDESE